MSASVQQVSASVDEQSTAMGQVSGTAMGQVSGTAMRLTERGESLHHLVDAFRVDADESADLDDLTDDLDDLSA